MPKAKARLSDALRAFVVRELACYAGSTDVVEMLKEQFGVTITSQGVDFYNPERPAGKALAKKWKAMFHVAREEFLTNFAKTVPEANKAVRVKELAMASRVFKKRGNHIAQANMLEQIAKEVGNVHTNRREITGKDGGPMKVQEVEDLSIEETRDELRKLLTGSKAAVAVGTMLAAASPSSE